LNEVIFKERGASSVDGPIFVSLTDDTDDYTATISDSLWLAGERMAIIGKELFVFRKVQDIGGGKFRIIGLLRALFDVVPSDHYPEETVYLFRRDDLTVFSNQAIPAGTSSNWKAQPDNIDLGEVDPVELNIVGKKDRPRPVDDFHGESAWDAEGRNYDTMDAWDDGSDITFHWLYRNRTGVGTAGDQIFGGSWGSDDPGSEGTFRIDIFKNGAVIRSITAPANSTSAVYTDAQITSDFGIPPASFVASLFAVDIFDAAEPQQITMRKR